MRSSVENFSWGSCLRVLIGNSAKLLTQCDWSHSNESHFLFRCLSKHSEAFQSFLEHVLANSLDFFFISKLPIEFAAAELLKRLNARRRASVCERRKVQRLHASECSAGSSMNSVPSISSTRSKGRKLFSKGRMPDNRLHAHTSANTTIISRHKCH